jgi:hypothetical protein
VVDNDTIESFLIRMDRASQQLHPGLWLLDEGNGRPPIIVRHDPPIVCVRLKVMTLPHSGREGIYRRLLELNADGIAFGAYAVDGDDVYLLDTLRSESLVYDELLASIESLCMAASEHYRELAPMTAAGE